MNNNEFNFSTKEIQRDALLLLQQTITDLSAEFDDFYWSYRNEEDQADYGIDLQYELFQKSTKESNFIFKIQLKGSGSAIELLKTGDRHGFISYQVPLRKINYYRNEINVPLLFILCDNPGKIVYWYAIQLDNTVEESVEIAKKKGAESVQVYIDPSNQLNSSTVSRFLKEVSLSFNEQAKKTRGNDFFKQFVKAEEIQIDRSRHILDQTVDALEIYFDEFDFIPPDILVNMYPFRSKVFYCHYSCFSADIDNESLYKLLVAINEEKVADQEILLIENYQEKVKNVIKIIKRNEIDKVIFRNKDLRIKGPDDLYTQICECGHCTYDKMLFSVLLEKSLSVVGDILQGKLFKAYHHYRLGNFITAYYLFKKAGVEAKISKKLVLYFICQYNMTKLRPMISAYCVGHPERENVLKELEGVDLVTEIQYIKDQISFGYNILELIVADKFYHNALTEIADLVDKIESRYHSQLKGGISNNSFACQLINEIAIACEFISKNGIAFDSFPEFGRLMSLAFGGLICSHAINDIRNSRLSSFGDFLIGKMLFYGRSESLLDYIRRYNLKTLHYVSDNENASFRILMSNLIQNIKDKKETIALLEVGNSYFEMRLNNIFENGLVLATFMDLKREEVRLIADEIFSVMEQINDVLSADISHLSRFVEMRGDDFNMDTLRRALKLTLTIPRLHESELIFYISGKISNRAIDIEFSNSEIANIENIYSNKCFICNFDHSNESLVYYQIIAAGTSKGKLKDLIETELRNKFSPSLYYNACIFNVISPTEHFKEYLAYARPNLNRVTFGSIFGRTDKVNFSINRAIEIAYRYAFNLSEPEFNVFRNYDLYYDWLLDPEGFDYSQFNPEWLLIFPSDHYLRRFQINKKLKRSLQSYLGTNKNERLIELYIKYFLKNEYSKN